MAAGVLSGPPDWLAEAEESPLTGLVAPQHQEAVSRPFFALGGTAAPLAAAVLRRAGTEAAVSVVLSAAAQPAALQQAARQELPARADSGAFVQRETGAGRMASFSGSVWPGGVFDSAQAGAAASAAWQTAAAQRIAALFPVPEPSAKKACAGCRAPRRACLRRRSGSWCPPVGRRCAARNVRKPGISGSCGRAGLRKGFTAPPRGCMDKCRICFISTACFFP